MKGIIFNLVEEVVGAHLGEDAWDEVVAEAGVEGAYTSLGTYPDAELLALVGAVSARTGAAPDDVVRLVGSDGLALLAQRYPEFMAGHDGVLPFLLTLNDVIHPEVRKLYPGAQVPHFSYRLSSPDVLDLEYRSQRGMCALAEGLTLGAARWYGQAIDLEQVSCVHRGDPSCVLRVSLQPGP